MSHRGFLACLDWVSRVLPATLHFIGSSWCLDIFFETHNLLGGTIFHVSPYLQQ
jgi:hypothetical protein